MNLQGFRIRNFPLPFTGSEVAGIRTCKVTIQSRMFILMPCPFRPSDWNGKMSMEAKQAWMDAVTVRQSYNIAVSGGGTPYTGRAGSAVQGLEEK